MIVILDLQENQRVRTMSIHRNMHRLCRGLKRSALSTALGVCFVGGAYAQARCSLDTMALGCDVVSLAQP